MSAATGKMCAVVLLLLARLLVGATAHAMPHHMKIFDEVADAPTHQKAPCAEHADTDTSSDGQHSTYPGEHSIEEHDAEHWAAEGYAGEGAAEDQPDCCKNNACECVSANGAALLGPMSVTSLALIDGGCLASLPLPPASHRLAALFRPPA